MGISKLHKKRKLQLQHGREVKKQKLLEKAKSSTSAPEMTLTGRRIISCESLTAAMKGVAEHYRTCNLDFNLKNEDRLGIQSQICYACACGWEVVVRSDHGTEQYPVNEGLAWGCVNATIGHDDLSTVFTCIDVPPPSWHTYKKQQDIVEGSLPVVLEKSMKEAGDEERRLAIEAGNFVNVGGIIVPCIYVYVDGGWAVRSYTHSYTSNYGHAAIIGVRTKKVLYVGTRQKYCYICTKYRNKTQQPPQHVCHKNWSKSSTAMEGSILSEGFENSLGMHHLAFTTFIGDGDSSVHSAVKYIYPGVEVRKIECINHVIRNVNSKLTQISSAGKNKWKISQDERRIPGMEGRFNQIGRLLHNLSRYFNLIGDFEKNYVTLADAVRNICPHIFGNHTRCADFYCDKIGSEEPIYHTVKDLPIYQAVIDVLARPANLARSLIECQTSNVVESFMSTVAKYIEGKRKNLGGMGLYKSKIFASSFAFNTTPFFSASASKYLTAKSPNLLWKKKNVMAKKRRCSGRSLKHKPRVLRFNFLKAKGDSNYGENPMRPDLPDADLTLAVANLKSNLQVDREEQQRIEKATKEQADSELWETARKYRITASIAGKIYSLRDSSNNLATIKSIVGDFPLYGVAAVNVKYGKDHEKIAVEKYEEVMGLAKGSVSASGFFVSLEDGIFGASPDGLIDENGLLEVKCPISIKDLDPNDWHKSSSSPLQFKDGIVVLKRSHYHFYQVVMQLMVTGRVYCDYFVWTNVGHFMERIYREEAAEVWEKMRPKLWKFWNEDLAPELVDSRLARGFKECRLPAYRLLAMKKLPNKTKTKLSRS